jgi:multidrug efflux pump subunit AcrB
LKSKALIAVFYKPATLDIPVLRNGTVLTIGLSSDHKDLMQLRDLVDKMLVPRILSVHGVADVNIFGGDIRQLQIQLDPLKLSSARSLMMRLKALG